MKASLTAKIIIVLCLFCIMVGVIQTDNHKVYQSDTKQSKKIISNTNKIAVIELDGAIASSAETNFFSNEASATNMLKSLKAAKNDKEIKGVILKINSPGGTVAMSQNIYNQIIATKKIKPVISVFEDVAASGGYYIASASDRIIAQEGTLTGSIGVIFSFMDYHNLLADKLNINPVVIKSGKYKDIGSGTREMTEEERELMQNIVNDSYAQFLNAIRVGRIKRDDKYTAKKADLTEETLVSHADGRVFTGKQAKELGFVDETGDIDTAKTMIEQMAREKFSNALSAKLISYNKTSSLSDFFAEFSEYSSRSNINLKDIVPTSMILSRKPLYLWE